MDYMNKKSYWQFRNIRLACIFWFKEKAYRICGNIDSKKIHRSVGIETIITIIVGIIECIVLEFLIGYIEGEIAPLFQIDRVGTTTYNSIIISGVATAVVILGLYCSNISSVYSASYVNAPSLVANLFYNDRLTRQCVTSIIDYIIFGFFQLFITLYLDKVWWTSVILFSFWSIAVVVSFTIAGKRAFQLSDVYSLAAYPQWTIKQTISSYLNHFLYSADMSFQTHFLKTVENQLGHLKAIQKYGCSKNISDNPDNVSMLKFINSNTELIKMYWEQKRNIPWNSGWFRNEIRYKRWQHISDIEARASLDRGIPLGTTGERDRQWLENEIFSINLPCIEKMISQRAYTEIICYLDELDELRLRSIECYEIDCYLNHLDNISKLIDKQLNVGTDEGDRKIFFSGMIEKLSLLYLNMVFDAHQFCSSLDENRIVDDVVRTIDSGAQFEDIKLFNNISNKNFYKKITTEVAVEGKRITPTWLIKQELSKDEYIKLNALALKVGLSFERAMDLGKKCNNLDMLFEACLVLIKFYEFENKVSRLISLLKTKMDDLCQNNIEHSNWGDSNVVQLSDVINRWKGDIPEILTNCVCQFSYINFDEGDKYPDFLGSCFYHICEDALDSIISNDIQQFNVDYTNLSKLTLFYHDYISKEYKNNRNIINPRYALDVLATPVAEWAQIGGLAAIWGEFLKDSQWKECVNNSVNLVIETVHSKDVFISGFVELIQYKSDSVGHIGTKAMLEYNWNCKVEDSIKKTITYSTISSVYGKKLNTESKFLNAFCPSFDDYGFVHDPSELFLVMIVNPIIPHDKQFHSKSSWENKAT